MALPGDWCIEELTTSHPFTSQNHLSNRSSTWITGSLRTTAWPMGGSSCKNTKTPGSSPQGVDFLDALKIDQYSQTDKDRICPSDARALESTPLGLLLGSLALFFKSANSERCDDATSALFFLQMALQLQEDYQQVDFCQGNYNSSTFCLHLKAFCQTHYIVTCTFLVTSLLDYAFILGMANKKQPKPTKSAEELEMTSHRHIAFLPG